jgi:hypothetical protein
MPKKVGYKSKKNSRSYKTKKNSRSYKTKKVGFRKTKKGGSKTPPTLETQIQELPEDLRGLILTHFKSGLVDRVRPETRISNTEAAGFNPQYFDELPLLDRGRHLKVGEVPGVNSVSASTMNQNGIIYAYELIGKFLSLKKNRIKFKEWLSEMITDKNNIDTCTSSISQYVKQNIERDLKDLDLRTPSEIMEKGFDLNGFPGNFVPEKLKQYEITQNYQLVGDFLCFQLSEDSFIESLNSMIVDETANRATQKLQAQESIRITNVIKTFVNQRIFGIDQ